MRPLIVVITGIALVTIGFFVDLAAVRDAGHAWR